MDMVTLVFRKYRTDGTVDNSARILSRECQEADSQSHVNELRSHGYELEAVLRRQDRP